MTRKNVHVVPRSNGDKPWAVKTEGASRAAGLYDTKQQAIEAGRKLAQNNQSDNIIHRQDGVITDRDSYGRDPNPPRDKKH